MKKYTSQQIHVRNVEYAACQVDHGQFYNIFQQTVSDTSIDNQFSTLVNSIITLYI